MSFLKAAIPKREVSFPEITLDQWRHAIAKKKKAAAIGPDGVSRADMLNAPESTHLAMLELIKALEAGHDWPTGSHRTGSSIGQDAASGNCPAV